jgi:hypothetical protein
MEILQWVLYCAIQPKVSLVNPLYKFIYNFFLSEMDRFYGRGNLLPVLQTGRFGVSAVVSHASVTPGRVRVLAL